MIVMSNAAMVQGIVALSIIAIYAGCLFLGVPDDRYKDAFGLMSIVVTVYLTFTATKYVPGSSYEVKEGDK